MLARAADHPTPRERPPIDDAHERHALAGAGQRLVARMDAALDAEPRPHHTEPASPPDAAALVYEILSHLEPKDRLVLTLFYLDQCAAGEIAGQTGWSETLVRVRLHRARARLRKVLESNPAWRDAL